MRNGDRLNVARNWCVCACVGSVRQRPRKECASVYDARANSCESVCLFVTLCRNVTSPRNKGRRGFLTQRSYQRCWLAGWRRIERICCSSSESRHAISRPTQTVFFCPLRPLSKSEDGTYARAHSHMCRRSVGSVASVSLSVWM